MEAKKNVLWKRLNTKLLIKQLKTAIKLKNAIIPVIFQQTVAKISNTKYTHPKVYCPTRRANFQSPW